MIKMSEELMEWVKTVRELGNQDAIDKELLVGVQEVVCDLWEQGMLDDDEYLKVSEEISDIFMDERWD